METSLSSVLSGAGGGRVMCDYVIIQPTMVSAFGLL